MRYLAPGSKISPSGEAIGFLGGTSASGKTMYKSQIEHLKEPRHDRIIDTNMSGNVKVINWLNEDEHLRIDMTLNVIKSSIESPTTVRPEWVKSGKDFVRWMQIRRRERIDSGES